MMGVFGSSAAQQQQLLNDARNGDPAAIAAYTASLGAPTITDRGQINSILSTVADTYVWNPNAGPAVDKETWIANGGDPSILTGSEHNFSLGGWVKAKGNQGGVMLSNIAYPQSFNLKKIGAAYYTNRER